MLDADDEEPTRLVPSLEERRASHVSPVERHREVTSPAHRLKALAHGAVHPPRLFLWILGAGGWVVAGMLAGVLLARPNPADVPALSGVVSASTPAPAVGAAPRLEDAPEPSKPPALALDEAAPVEEVAPPPKFSSSFGSTSRPAVATPQAPAVVAPAADPGRLSPPSHPANDPLQEQPRSRARTGALDSPGF